MISIQINHQSDYKPRFDIHNFIEKALAKKNIQTGFFEFSFVDDPTILTINKAHLNHDYVTDIITFNLPGSGLFFSGKSSNVFLPMTTAFLFEQLIIPVVILLK